LFNVLLLYVFRMEIKLDYILEKSEHLFYRYCKKTVEDSFLMVESPRRK